MSPLIPNFNCTCGYWNVKEGYGTKYPVDPKTSKEIIDQM